MKLASPFFSIIIPTYNREEFLKKAVDSVLAQTFGNFELIISDDGSDDHTKELIRQYQDPRIKYFFQEKHGVAFARNQGIKKAEGEFIAFLDSDDWWLAEKLEKTQGYIRQFPEIKIFHTEEIWYRGGKLLRQKKKHKKPTGYVYPYALKLCCISISTAVVHRSVFDEAGIFDENFEACEDYDFWLRATCRFPVKLIPEFLTEKDGGRPDQLSVSVWGLDRFRIRALMKMLDSGILDEENYFLTLEEMKKKAKVFIKGCEKRGKKKEAEAYIAFIKRFQTR